jgi:hypothetical protein
LSDNEDIGLAILDETHITIRTAAVPMAADAIPIEAPISANIEVACSFDNPVPCNDDSIVLCAT